jgi:hypothetical protein
MFRLLFEGEQKTCFSNAKRVENLLQQCYSVVVGGGTAAGG